VILKFISTLFKKRVDVHLIEIGSTATLEIPGLNEPQ